MERPKEGSWF